MKKISRNPLISVIMNCHNGQEFVQESVKSLISQTYKNWELIFYDNFSRDLSIKIIRSFKDKRIKFFKSNKFLKLYDARNNAIKFAKGKYIAFLDTDDYWKKDKLTKQVNFILKKKIKMCYSNYYIHYNSKKKRLRVLKDNFDVNTKNLINDYNIGILTVLLERSIFKKIKFNKKFEIIGDFDFFIKLSEIMKIGFINEPLAFYRVHDSNLSKQRINLHIKELSRWIDEKRKNLEKKNVSIKNLSFFLMKLKIKNILNI